MPGWPTLLAGLLIWTAQFFASYAVSSVFGSGPLARILVGLITLVALGYGVWLFRRIRSRDRPAPLDGWLRHMALLVLAIGMVSVVWQGLPALIGV